MPKWKKETAQSNFVLRSVLTRAQGQFTVTEVWDEGESFVGLSYNLTSVANVRKLNRKTSSAPFEAKAVSFDTVDEARRWFAQCLRVENDEWLDVWTTDIRVVEPWIIDGLRFADNDTVDIVALAESFDDVVEEWAFERLETNPLVWKPVRVAGRLIAGFPLESGEVAYFAFDDDSVEFEFQKSLANYSWFMDNTGAPISWNGGREIGFVNEPHQLLAESNSGDYEEPFEIWELKSGQTVAQAIVEFFLGKGDGSAEHILFLELGAQRVEGVFTEDEWSMLQMAVSESQDETDGWMGCWVSLEYRSDVAEIAREKSKLFRAMHEFFTNPSFEYHDLALDSWDTLMLETNSFAWDEVFLHGSSTYVAPRESDL